MINNTFGMRMHGLMRPHFDTETFQLHTSWEMLVFMIPKDRAIVDIEEHGDDYVITIVDSSDKMRERMQAWEDQRKGKEQ